MLISDHELCLDASMDQVLTKPIGKKALIAAIWALKIPMFIPNIAINNKLVL
jgi:CheY-like chemotaxis protein